MTELKWLDGNRVKIAPPRKCKKCTGTRFATIMGLNPYATPFEMWCAITRVYEKPFTDTKYTRAGKVIEPLQADYVERSYNMNIVRPADVYGEDFFHKTYGDFFHENKKLGGMWDYLVKGQDGKIKAVLEMKTTKRVEDWQDDVPEYYALQAALYAYLLGVDNVIMVASFLSDKDYDNPAAYVPSVNNTITIPFKISERYPDFADKVAMIEQWWADYVDTGISPAYDEKRDAEILKELRKNALDPQNTDIADIISQAESLKKELDAENAKLADKEKQLKQLAALITEYAQGQFRDGDTQVEVAGNTYKFVLTRSTQIKVDKDALKADGLLDKYSKKSETYRMTVK